MLKFEILRDILEEIIIIYSKKWSSTLPALN